LLPGLFRADHQLAGERAALFHIDRTRHDIAIKRSGTADRHDRLGHDLARHFAPNLNRANLELPKKLHVSFFSDQNRGCCHLSVHLNRRTELHFFNTLQAAAKLALDDGGAADDAAAAEIAGRRHVNFAMRANGPAESGVDLVIAQVHMDAARRTNRRTRGGVQLLYCAAVETGNRGDPWAMPNASNTPKQRLRGDHAAEFQDRFRCDARRGYDGEMPAALSTKRALGCSILHLPKAAVRTLDTDLGRRFGHRLAGQAMG